MERIFVVVTPACPHYSGRKVGSKECTQCDHFRGGILQNFVDCAHNRPKSVPKTPKSVPKTPKSVPKTPKSVRKPAKIVQETKKKGRPAQKAISKPVKTRKPKNG